MYPDGEVGHPTVNINIPRLLQIIFRFVLKKNPTRNEEIGRQSPFLLLSAPNPSTAGVPGQMWSPAVYGRKVLDRFWTRSPSTCLAFSVDLLSDVGFSFVASVWRFFRMRGLSIRMIPIACPYCCLLINKALIYDKA